MSLLLPGAVVLGIVVGATVFPQDLLPELNNATMFFLYALLVGVGINLTMDADVPSLLKKIRPSTLLVIPLSALGSVVGAAAALWILGESALLGATIGAGFGWYSLASVLLAESLGAEVAALAFLTNTFRELLAILLLPKAVRRFGLAGMTLGGATTMDTTLALISEAGDQELTILALLHGLSLSTLVPVLVPLFASLVSRAI